MVRQQCRALKYAVGKLKISNYKIFNKSIQNLFISFTSTNSLWACGLAVMTTPLHGVGHQFEMSSLRDSQAENLVGPIARVI